MARGRKQPALFEVIQKGNKSKSAFSAPKWWFKGQKVAGGSVAETVSVSIPAPHTPPQTVAPTAPTTYSPTYSPTTAPVVAPPAVPAPPAPATLPGASINAPTVAPTVSPMSVSVTARIGGSTAKPIAPSEAAVVNVDGDRQEISLRLTFTTAAIVVFAIVVCIALAVIAGKKLSSKTPQPAQPSAQEVAGGTADPSVLSVTPGKSGGNETGGTPSLPPGVTPGEPVAAAPTPGIVRPPAIVSKPATAVPGEPPSPPAASGKRTAGLNYLVVQSYPEEADAKAAVDVLAHEGIEASIERKLRGFNASWYQVVTTEGYVGRSDPNYEKMMSHLKAVSEKTRATNRKFKALEPVMFKWSGQ